MNRSLATGLSLIVCAMPIVIASCSSGALKLRQEQRDRVVQSSKIYCEFVNGDNNSDIDVAVNLAMGAKCESAKDFSLVNYRTPSEINGVLFCCGTKEPKPETPAELPSRKDLNKVTPAPTPATAAPAAAVAPATVGSKTAVKSKVEDPKANNSIRSEAEPETEQ
jgi:hypothetical protein